MWRGTEVFIAALLMVIIGFVIGIFFVGLGEQQYMTSRGIVEMTDTATISRALKDPTFTSTFSLGSFSLLGMSWPLIFPFGGAVISFIAVLIFHAVVTIKRPRNNDVLITIKKLFLALLLFLLARAVGADQVSYPDMPELRQYSNMEYQVSIQFPSQWKTDAPIRNELWISQGPINESLGICFVRVSEVVGLRFSTPDEFFSQTDENSFIKLTSMSMPDIKVHLFDMAYLGGRKSRRIIYSGTDTGIKTGNVIYQALDGDRIFTVGCLSELSVFNLVYNHFEAIISRFKFEAKKP